MLPESMRADFSAICAINFRELQTVGPNGSTPSSSGGKEDARLNSSDIENVGKSVLKPGHEPGNNIGVVVNKLIVDDGAANHHTEAVSCLSLDTIQVESDGESKMNKIELKDVGEININNRLLRPRSGGVDHEAADGRKSPISIGTFASEDVNEYSEKQLDIIYEKDLENGPMTHGDTTGTSSTDIGELYSGKKTLKVKSKEAKNVSNKSNASNSSHSISKMACAPKISKEYVDNRTRDSPIDNDISHHKKDISSNTRHTKEKQRESTPNKENISVKKSKDISSKEKHQGQHHSRGHSKDKMDSKTDTVPHARSSLSRPVSRTSLNSLNTGQASVGKRSHRKESKSSSHNDLKDATTTNNNAKNVNSNCEDVNIGGDTNCNSSELRAGLNNKESPLRGKKHAGKLARQDSADKSIQVILEGLPKSASCSKMLCESTQTSPSISREASTFNVQAIVHSRTKTKTRSTQTKSGREVSLPPDMKLNKPDRIPTKKAPVPKSGVSKSMSTGKLSSRPPSAAYSTASKPLEIRKVKMVHYGEEDLGFCIRGGKEVRSGIYVSDVDIGGQAEKQGLQIGDRILKVNDTSFRSISHDDAVSTVRNTNRITMYVTAAFGNRMPHGKATAMTVKPKNGVKKGNVKSVVFQADADGWLGCSIRGGTDYGMDPMISNVEAGSPADKVGLKTGDLIVKLNDIDVSNMTHMQIVSLATSCPELRLLIRPMEKPLLQADARESGSTTPIASPEQPRNNIDITQANRHIGNNHENGFDSPSSLTTNGKDTVTPVPTIQSCSPRQHVTPTHHSNSSKRQHDPNPTAETDERRKPSKLLIFIQVPTKTVTFHKKTFYQRKQPNSGSSPTTPKKTSPTYPTSAHQMEHPDMSGEHQNVILTGVRKTSDPVAALAAVVTQQPLPNKVNHQAGDRMKTMETTANDSDSDFALTEEVHVNKKNNNNNNLTTRRDSGIKKTTSVNESELDYTLGADNRALNVDGNKQKDSIEARKCLLNELVHKLEQRNSIPRQETDEEKRPTGLSNCDPASIHERHSPDKSKQEHLQKFLATQDPYVNSVNEPLIPQKAFNEKDRREMQQKRNCARDSFDKSSSSGYGQRRSAQPVDTNNDHRREPYDEDLERIPVDRIVSDRDSRDSGFDSAHMRDNKQDSRDRSENQCIPEDRIYEQTGDEYMNKRPTAPDDYPSARSFDSRTYNKLKDSYIGVVGERGGDLWYPREPWDRRPCESPPHQSPRHRVYDSPKQRPDMRSEYDRSPQHTRRAEYALSPRVSRRYDSQSHLLEQSPRHHYKQYNDNAYNWRHSRDLFDLYNNYIPSPFDSPLHQRVHEISRLRPEYSYSEFDLRGREPDRFRYSSDYSLNERLLDPRNDSSIERNRLYQHSDRGINLNETIPYYGPVRVLMDEREHPRSAPVRYSNDPTVDERIMIEPMNRNYDVAYDERRDGGHVYLRDGRDVIPITDQPVGFKHRVEYPQRNPRWDPYDLPAVYNDERIPRPHYYRESQSYHDLGPGYASGTSSRPRDGHSWNSDSERHGRGDHPMVIGNKRSNTLPNPQRRHLHHQDSAQSLSDNQSADRDDTNEQNRPRKRRDSLSSLATTSTQTETSQRGKSGSKNKQSSSKSKSKNIPDNSSDKSGSKSSGKGSSRKQKANSSHNNEVEHGHKSSRNVPTASDVKITRRKSWLDGAKPSALIDDDKFPNNDNINERFELMRSASMRGNPLRGIREGISADFVPHRRGNLNRSEQDLRGLKYRENRMPNRILSSEDVRRVYKDENDFEPDFLPFARQAVNARAKEKRVHQNNEISAAYEDDLAIKEENTANSEDDTMKPSFISGADEDTRPAKSPALSTDSHSEDEQETSETETGVGSESEVRRVENQEPLNSVGNNSADDVEIQEWSL
ncbi:uncharacterized protein LOC141901813 isoform X2 [Tubulanus polymorphus]|uniref:uncharacterized protein LOC141901813 isoform X2 n=1 Tax=Tubulanus polymorphus TaxID=672921 RepID=UPI003DA6C50C